MNKKISRCLYFIFLSLGALAHSDEMGESLNKTSFRSAAFIPASSRFRQIYGNVGVSLQAEEARAWKTHRNLETWGNIEWIFMDGEPRQRCGTTDIDILNISLGLKAIGKIYRDFIFLYVGIGPDLGIVFVKNKMRCCSGCGDTYKESTSRVGIGGILKTGGQIYLGSYVYLDLFADYLYLPIHFSNTVDVGGCKAGGGLGARF